MSKTDRTPFIKLLKERGGSAEVPHRVLLESTASGHYERLVRQSTSRNPGRRSVIRTDFGLKRASRTGSHGEPTRRSSRGGATDIGIR